MWQVDLGQLPDAWPAALATGWERKRMEKLLHQDKDREITYQFPSQTKQTQFQKKKFNHCQLKYVWIVRKKPQNNPHLLPTLYSHCQLPLHSWLMCPRRCKGGEGAVVSPSQPLSAAPSSLYVQLTLPRHINGIKSTLKERRCYKEEEGSLLDSYTTACFFSGSQLRLDHKF